MTQRDCCGAIVRDRLNGIDDVEVFDHGLRLCVHFIGDIPPLADAEHPDGLTLDEVVISGGTRIRNIRVVRLEIHPGDEDEEPCLEVIVDRCGDFSTYELCLRKRRVSGGDADDTGLSEWGPYPGFDPRYGCASFRFRLDCPSDIDCVDGACTGMCAGCGGCTCAGACGCVAQPVEAAPPVTNYLAKDYASFLRIMYDRLAETLPEWTERHEADLGVALVELLAYVADHLSYYQDAIATEAYLGTARRRISVRRHVRLVGYDLHEGVNARAWVTVQTAADAGPFAVDDLFFVTRIPGLSREPGTVLTADDLQPVPQDSYSVFEIVADALPQAEELRFRAAHSTIQIHTWDDRERILPRGSTRATLLDEGSRSDETVEPSLHLTENDVLIFEEVVSPRTGSIADADPGHRHAVRLTSVTRPYDDDTLVEIEWGREDALPFDLCLTAELPAPDCRCVRQVSVARGNVVPVDHGRTVRDPAWDAIGSAEEFGDCGCEGSVIDIASTPVPVVPTLTRVPLTFATPGVIGPATVFARQDPRRALPAVSVSIRPPLDDPGPDVEWRPLIHLIDSEPTDTVFVVEVDDDGVAHLRFGDGTLGARPSTGSRGTARYRVGNGPAGNVGRDTIAHAVLRGGSSGGISLLPRNPLAAAGGMSAEAVDEARLLAPHAFRSERRRAVTAEDYAEIAGRHPRLQRAAAQLAWTGSWYEARVGADPFGTEEPGEDLLIELESFLARYRRMGHDFDVVAARYVPLDIELSVCVEDHHLRGDVRQQLLAVFGRTGFFHPDRHWFGEAIRVSQLVASAQAIAGVESVTVTRLRRLFEPPAGEIENGLLPIGPMEIARLDNDPSLPEHGRLSFKVGGGR